MTIRVKNWKDFQHYKDRAPPWIKLHKGLLDNYDYQRLPIASRALAPMLWLLASESEDGSLTADPAKIAFRLRTSEAEVVEALNPLIQAGFFVSSGGVLAEREQPAMPETEVETEAEREKEAEKKPRASASGSRLPADWVCPDGWTDDAIQIRPAWTRDHVASVADGFRDYWVGVAGAKGRKLDWRATWRNWVRTHRDAGGTTGPPRSQFMSHADQSKLAAARTIFGTEIEASHGTNNGRTIDITPASRQVGQQNIPGAAGQLRLAVPEPVEDWASTG